ncbi:MAG: helix-turn-helix domain-containing protein, partial [Fimbriimonadales bacterium]
CCEQLLVRLEAELDAVERAILAGLRAEKTQAEIAQALGISPPSLHKRLRKIQEKARAILGEIGGEKGLI